MHVPLARSDYYEASAPPDGPQPATDLPTTRPAARRPGRPQVVPTFTGSSTGQIGAQLYPGRPRHAYAVDLQRGLPTVCCTSELTTNHNFRVVAAERPLASRSESHRRTPPLVIARSGALPKRAEPASAWWSQDGPRVVARRHVGCVATAQPTRSDASPRRGSRRVPPANATSISALRRSASTSRCFVSQCCFPLSSR
jgi:hypothetical protein